MRKDGVKPKEQLLREPYHRDHALVIGVHRAAKKKKKKDERCWDKKIDDPWRWHSLAAVMMP